MKKILIALFLLLLIFVGIIIFKTLSFKPSSYEAKAIPKIDIDSNAKHRLAEAISIRTISFEDEEDFDSTQFQLFNIFLAENYPLLHEKAEHKIFNGYSHLFKLQGSEVNESPIILMGHIDVVPIASPAIWSVHPFTAGIKMDTIYGRGTIDDKSAVISLLEAMENLLSEDFIPRRTIYLSFGHDEEVSGGKGAGAIVKYLEEQNVKSDFILDEGGAITQGLIPGVEKETALIGIAEKGYVTYELTVNMMGGHSSQPATETSIDVLSSAISTLKKNKFPGKITPALEAFMDAAGPHMGFTSRMAFANKTLFSSIIKKQYEKSNQGNANIRTTTSPTIFEAGIKENVIPTSSRAVVNFRILPGETVETVKDHIVNTIADDRVQVEIKGTGFNPSPISPSDNQAFTNLQKSILEIYPGILTVPNLVIGATDSRYYNSISNNIYRFAPFHLNPKNINCFHGVDERISVEEFEDAIRFYRQIILNNSTQ
jgi:carboxypeptidase PM20D1